MIETLLKAIYTDLVGHGAQIADYIFNHRTPDTEIQAILSDILLLQDRIKRLLKPRQ